MIIETMAGYRFEKIFEPGPRPKEAPKGWIIFNAPRPIDGTMKKTAPGGGTRWSGPAGPTGIHWAAVDPKDTQAEIWIRRNYQNKAVVVEFSEETK